MYYVQAILNLNMYVPLLPPIMFGRTHSHQIRTTVFFAQPVILISCQLSLLKKYFQYKATLWWNALSEEMLMMARNFSDKLLLYL